MRTFSILTFCPSFRYGHYFTGSFDDNRINPIFQEAESGMRFKFPLFSLFADHFRFLNFLSVFLGKGN